MAAGPGFGGKVAVVTGGGSGIGAALAAELRRRGATVVTADLQGGDVELDVRHRTAVTRLVEEVGPLDLLFNHAGLVATPMVAADSMTEHGVVGLSLGLRVEAARHGVKRRLEPGRR